MKQSILVVDDYADARDLLDTLLTREGYQVLTAADGAEGLKVACETQPDAIIMDIFMPTMDGLEATARLKADPRTANTPVIAYTAKPPAVDGKDDFFAAVCAKPCPPALLLSVLQQVLPPR